MTSLFGVPLTSIMVGLLLLMGLAFLVLGWIAWRNPLLVRMGLRNIGRRRAQTALIVMGLMLSTLIVSAAFATGDTVGYSITNTIYNQLEQVDFLISFRQDASKLDRPPGYTDTTFLQQLRDQFASNPNVDGITGTTIRPLPVLNPQARLSDPSAVVVGVDPATVDPFQGLRDAKTDAVLPAATLQDDHVYVSQNLAEKIDAKAGDTIQVYYDNQPHAFQVAGVVRDTSLTAQGNGPNAGGLVMNLDRAWALTGQPGKLNNIEVSLRGGTRGTLNLIDPMDKQLQQFIDAHPESGAHIDFTKKELVRIGEIAGSIFVTFFLVFGLFSMAAGILLIFLIFVMLAAERRSEMGMARAIGMSRLHLTEMFIAEGMAYNVGAAMVGALLGLGVAWLLIFALGRIFSGFGLSIAFHINPVGFVISYAAGVVVTFATVAFASWRAANLNIVRAIRDLPEPQLFRSARPSVRELLLGAVGALWYLAWVAIIALGAVMGFALFVFSLGFYGLPFAIVIPIVALFVAGIRLSSRGLYTLNGWRPWITWAAWVLLFFPVALLSMGLLATRAWAARHRHAGGWAFLMLVAGVVFTYLGGWVWGQAFAYTGGTTLAVLAVAMLAVYFGAGPRAAFTTAGLLLVWYWLLPLPFSLVSEAGKGWSDPLRGLFRLLPLAGPKEIRGQIEMFFVSGVSITSAATLVVIFNATALLAPLTALGRVLGGIVPAIRTAIAYPLAARFRTAMTLSMFGLVVFSLVVMAFLNYNFTQLFLGDQARAGFDVRVLGNAGNPVPDLRAALQQSDPAVVAQISAVGKTVAAEVLAHEDGATVKALPAPIVGGDQEFFQVARLPLSTRAAGYGSDEAVIAAIQRDPSLVIASEDILKTAGGGFTTGEPSRFQLSMTQAQLDAAPWQPIAVTLTDPDTGATKQVRIIGFMQSQVTGVLIQLMGIMSTEASVAPFATTTPRNDFYVTTNDHSRAGTERIAKSIESALLERGVQADSIRKTIADQTTQSSAFSTLFEGFMSLGLIVGIAALGVIAFRTVVERRQQIGMLRAIGYSRRLVGISFFLESSFIALTGIVMGLVLGWALSFNLLGSPEFVGSSATKIDFRVPWVTLIVIVGIAYGASALMTFIPARSASRVAVAEALRYE